MSITKFDNITRSALWSSYNNICFYCNQPLDWDNLHIDHILPELYSKDIRAFEKIKAKFELDQNFDLNALYNLVPAHSKCNSNKSKGLFSKPTTLFYLGLTNNAVPKIQKEIEKLKQRKNKGQIISKLQSALAINLIDIKELEALLTKAKEVNWRSAEIKIPIGVEFIDDVYDLFYLYSDYDKLLDKKLLLGKGYDSLELENYKDEKRIVSTLREWREAVKSEFYPGTNFAIKMSSHFTFLDEFLEALHKARMPKLSFISEPWIELDNLDLLSPNILHDIEGKLKKYTDKGLSIGDLVRKGIITQNFNQNFKVSLEFEGIETSFIEQFRADFNNDGIEDIFIRGWTRAIGSSLGFGFTSILTKYSDTLLINELR